MWLTCLVTTVVVCLTVGKGYAQSASLPTSDPSVVPCLERLLSVPVIQSERRYIAVSKRGQNRLAFVRKFLNNDLRDLDSDRDVVVQQGDGVLPVFAVLNARQAANVSCTSNNV